MEHCELERGVVVECGEGRIHSFYDEEGHDLGIPALYCAVQAVLPPVSRLAQQVLVLLGHYPLQFFLVLHQGLLLDDPCYSLKVSLPYCSQHSVKALLQILGPIPIVFLTCIIAFVLRKLSYSKLPASEA